MAASYPRLQRQATWKSRAAVIAGASVCGATAIHLLQPRSPQLDTHAKAPWFQVPRPVVDGLAGAVGEVAQICVLYPLETIKVRCQADGVSAGQIMRGMIAKHGVSWTLMHQLYVGFSAAAGFSLVVGAVHWLSFCAAKRAALDTLPKQQQQQSAPPGLQQQPLQQQAQKQQQQQTQAQQQQQGTQVLQQQQQQQVTGQQQGGVGQAALAAGAVVAAGQGHERHNDSPYCEDELSQRTSANAIAAAVGALCTALVESPVELFRHQAQAGMISGKLTQEMGRAVQKGGPLALWAGFLPFLLEAFPYDMMELGSYSQLRDMWDAATRPGGRLHGIGQHVPDHALDLVAGAASGAIAVVVSMPFDCIKTYLQTRDMGSRFVGVRGQAGLFLATGMRMVKRRGLGSLYVGMIPRLVQQVPSSTICWWAVEQTGRLMEPYVQKPATALATIQEE